MNKGNAEDDVQKSKWCSSSNLNVSSPNSEWKGMHVRMNVRVSPSIFGAFSSNLNDLFSEAKISSCL